MIFSGTTDWDRLAGLIAESSYNKWVSMETLRRNHQDMNEEDFLQKAFKTGTEFQEMIDKKKEKI